MQKFDKGIQKMWQIKPRSVSHILGKKTGQLPAPAPFIL